MKSRRYKSYRNVKNISQDTRLNTLINMQNKRLNAIKIINKAKIIDIETIIALILIIILILIVILYPTIYIRKHKQMFKENNDELKHIICPDPLGGTIDISNNSTSVNSTHNSNEHIPSNYTEYGTRLLNNTQQVINGANTLINDINKITHNI